MKRVDLEKKLLIRLIKKDLDLISASGEVTKVTLVRTLNHFLNKAENLNN